MTVSRLFISVNLNSKHKILGPGLNRRFVLLELSERHKKNKNYEVKGNTTSMS